LGVQGVHDGAFKSARGLRTLNEAMLPPRARSHHRTSSEIAVGRALQWRAARCQSPRAVLAIAQPMCPSLRNLAAMRMFDPRRCGAKRKSAPAARLESKGRAATSCRLHGRRRRQ
jgi:hypothetical protein